MPDDTPRGGTDRAPSEAPPAQPSTADQFLLAGFAAFTASLVLAVFARSSSVHVATADAASPARVVASARNAANVPNWEDASRHGAHIPTIDTRGPLAGLPEVKLPADPFTPPVGRDEAEFEAIWASRIDALAPDARAALVSAALRREAGPDEETREGFPRWGGYAVREPFGAALELARVDPRVDREAARAAIHALGGEAVTAYRAVRGLTAEELAAVRGADVVSFEFGSGSQSSATTWAPSEVRYYTAPPDDAAHLPGPFSVLFVLHVRHAVGAAPLVPSRNPRELLIADDVRFRVTQVGKRARSTTAVIVELDEEAPRS